MDSVMYSLFFMQSFYSDISAVSLKIAVVDVQKLHSCVFSMYVFQSA